MTPGSTCQGDSGGPIFIMESERFESIYLDIYTYSNQRQESPIILGRPYLEFYHMVRKDATRPAPQFGSG